MQYVGGGLYDVSPELLERNLSDDAVGLMLKDIVLLASTMTLSQNRTQTFSHFFQKYCLMTMVCKNKALPLSIVIV